MNLNKKFWSLMGLMCVVALIGATPAHAADSKTTKEQLKARFEQRYPQLLKYKQEGKIGETMKGTVEIVNAKDRDNSELSRIVDDENSDREKLYQVIADDEKTTAAKVAERTAERNYEKAKPGEYLKSADGTWKKKS